MELFETRKYLRPLSDKDRFIIRRELLIFALSLSLVVQATSQTLKTDVLIIGGGASGTMAGIQAARMDVEAIIIEETPWLGGMLTAAGVSAIDGNHNMPSGLWGEFRAKLYNYYGGPKVVATGWVSNTLFEPAAGDKILKELASHQRLKIYYNTVYQKAERTQTGWLVTVSSGKNKKLISTRVLIDATELGDVAADLNAPYTTGMDSRDKTGEEFAPRAPNDIIQDMTYVVILEDYGKGADKTIAKPEGYNKADFECACEVSKSKGAPSSNCLQMMEYGKLPNNKYMINWPKCGNDHYLNLIDKSKEERTILLKQAKLHTLRFVYYLQTELGFKNLGIAENEFPTSDHLPMIPYHRESRRIKGMVQLTVMHLAKPFNQPEPYYRTGIAVGDYPIDHHHGKNTDAPAIDFINIKVPSYNIPLGVLIPKGVNGLIVAEKSISVTNIVNGTTRLQPVVMGIGQAAGALAAICVKHAMQPKDVSVREVQNALLQENSYLMPYHDVKPADPGFQAIQRIGATGILKGTGIPYKWANETWFYPEYPISEYEAVSGMLTYYPQIRNLQGSGARLSMAFFNEMLTNIDSSFNETKLRQGWEKLKLPSAFSYDLLLNRRAFALLIDHFMNPFEIPIDYNGNIKSTLAGGIYKE